MYGLSYYTKAITYILLSVIGGLTIALADGKVSEVDVINVAIAGIGAIPVYWFANRASGVFKYTKALSTFLVAGGMALSNFLIAGSGLADVTTSNWLAVVVAAFASIGVAIMPNTPLTRPDDYM